MTTFQSRATWKNNILSFGDKNLSPTAGNSLWDLCPTLAILQNPSIAYVFYEDFCNFTGTASATTLTGWTVTQASAGAVSITDAGAGGVLEIDSGSSTATQGANVQYNDSIFKPAASKDIWYECRFKIVDTYDKCELFVGLAEVDTTIIATSAVSTENHIGFSCVTDNGVILFNGEKATAGATQSCTTIAEDTWIKLGFHISGVTTATQYVNDVASTSTLATANIPIVGLRPSFVCQSGGTNDPIMHVDYVKVVQLR